jgi:DNA polymerase I-like protein with 3'-5' exonuclease and polymerase domains
MNFEKYATEAQVRALIEHHNNHSESVVLDTETTSVNPREAKLVDIQMEGYTPGHVVLFGAEFLPLLTELRPTLIFQNFKYDYKVAYLHGADLRGLKMRDPMLMHHLVDENADHSLDAWVQEQYGDAYKEEFWAKYDNYLDAPESERIEYACKDIIYTRHFYNSTAAALEADSIPQSLVEHVHRLALALFDTEVHGVKVDLNYTVTMGTELKSDIVKTERELRELGGYYCEAIEIDQWAKEINKLYKPGPRATAWKKVQKPDFNFNSSGQVAALLYDYVGLEPVFNKKTKQRTADDDALELLEYRHPIVPRIRVLRKYSKMYGSFVEGILERQQGSRIYPTFNVNGTKTGRISHSDPNLGQIPSRDQWSKIRGIFIPDEGECLISCDYGQLEICVAAHFSMDGALLKILTEGLSQHDLTAEGVGIPRHIAKTLNFGMAYLCGPGKVKEIVGCTDKQALEIWQQYWRTYEGLKAFIDWCTTQLDAGKPIANPFGRKRHFPGFQRPRWSDPSIGKYTREDRQCFNAVIQGTGSDLTSRSAYLVDDQLRARGWGGLAWTVHDELLIRAKLEHAEDARKLVQETMLNVGHEAGLRVNLSVDCSAPLSRWEK